VRGGCAAVPGEGSDPGGLSEATGGLGGAGVAGRAPGASCAGRGGPSPTGPGGRAPVVRGGPSRGGPEGAAVAPSRGGPNGGRDAGCSIRGGVASTTVDGDEDGSVSESKVAQPATPRKKSSAEASTGRSVFLPIIVDAPQVLPRLKRCVRWHPPRVSPRTKRRQLNIAKLAMIVESSGAVEPSAIPPHCESRIVKRPEQSAVAFVLPVLAGGAQCGWGHTIFAMNRYGLQRQKSGVADVGTLGSAATP